MSFQRVMALSDLWSGEMCSTRVEGKRVLLVRLGTRVCAYEDRCTHLGVALSEGRLEGHILTCRAHGYTYDVSTGCGVNPRETQLRPYATQVRDGEIWVDTQQASEQHGQG